MTGDTTTKRRLQSKKLSLNDTSDSSVMIWNYFLVRILSRPVVYTIFIGLFAAELYWNANCKRTKNAIKPQIWQVRPLLRSWAECVVVVVGVLGVVPTSYGSGSDANQMDKETLTRRGTEVWHHLRALLLLPQPNFPCPTICMRNMCHECNLQNL